MSNYVPYGVGGDPFARIASGLSGVTSGIRLGLEDAASAEAIAINRQRQAIQDLIAAEDRQRRIDMESYLMREKLAGRAAGLGQGEMAANLYNQAQDIRQRLTGSAGPEIMGSANLNVYDVETQQPMRDFNQPQTLQTIMGLTGTPAPRPILVPQGQTALDPMTRQPFFTAPMQARPLDPVTTQLRQAQIDRTEAQTARTQAGPAARGGGGGRSGGGAKLQSKVGANGNFWNFNPATGEYEDTGVAAKTQGGGGEAPKPADFGILTPDQKTGRIRLLAEQDDVNNPGGMKMGAGWQKALRAAQQQVEAEQAEARKAFDQARRQSGGGGKPKPTGKSAALLKMLREMK